MRHNHLMPSNPCKVYRLRCSSLSKHRPSSKAPSSTKEKIWSAGQKKRHAILRVSVLALPIFPGRRQPSIVGRNELNYRVRNGNGWTLALISTNYLLSGLPENILYYIVFSALCQEEFGDPYRIRTDVNGVRGRCLNHLTNGPWCTFTDSNRGPTD